MLLVVGFGGFWLLLSLFLVGLVVISLLFIVLDVWFLFCVGLIVVLGCCYWLCSLVFVALCWFVALVFGGTAAWSCLLAVVGCFNSVVSCLYILSICWLLVIFVNCLL